MWLPLCARAGVAEPVLPALQDFLPPGLASCTTQSSLSRSATALQVHPREWLAAVEQRRADAFRAKLADAVQAAVSVFKQGTAWILEDNVTEVQKASNTAK